LNYGTESLEEAAVRELAEETGIVVNVNQISLLGCCSDPHRDPRQHTITHVYLLNIPDDDFDIFMKSMLYSSNSEVLYVNIFPLDKLPRKIAFDHRKIITDMYGNPE
jgi:8-oxo-dGTP diphosphatase